MKRIVSMITLLLITAIVGNQNATYAQSASTNSPKWDSLRSLSIGDDVMIELKSGKEEKGKLDAVSDDSLSMSRKNKRKDFNRSDIRKIYRLKKKNPTKAVLIGAAVGFGAGAGTIAGIGGDDGASASPEFIIGGGLIGAGIGSLVGLAAGIGKSKTLIYETP